MRESERALAARGRACRCPQWQGGSCTTQVLRDAHLEGVDLRLQVGIGKRCLARQGSKQHARARAGHKDGR